MRLLLVYYTFLLWGARRISNSVCFYRYQRKMTADRKIKIAYKLFTPLSSSWHDIIWAQRHPRSAHHIEPMVIPFLYLIAVRAATVTICRAFTGPQSLAWRLIAIITRIASVHKCQLLQPYHRSTTLRHGHLQQPLASTFTLFHCPISLPLMSKG